MYRTAKALLFRLEPERAHRLTMRGLAWMDRHPGALTLLRAACRVDDERLRVRRFGLTFPSPVGLAAGLDKDAEAVRAWSALGFGFVEVGSVTAEPQPGNPRPRLFRLPEDGALVNRMGFNNEGADLVAARLARLRSEGGLRVPLGVNVGKSRSAPLEGAADDYRRSLSRLWPHADYLVVNVSSPNTPGLRRLQEGTRLAGLLELLVGLRDELGTKPTLLKVSPDLEAEEVHELVRMAEEHDMSGIVSTNTTVSRDGLLRPIDEAGGLSGRPLRARSLAQLERLNSYSRLPIVSVGGVASADDVIERLRAGASLVQLYTALIYEGPGLLRRIHRDLLAALDAGSLPSVESLVGAGA